MIKHCLNVSNSFDKMAGRTHRLVKDGFYEKDRLLWIKLENLKNHKNKFQSWYKTIIRKLEHTFKNFDKIIVLYLHILYILVLNPEK